MSIFTRFIRPIVQEERQRSKTEVQIENKTRVILRIGDTETSSPVTSCAGSTAISDRYKKIPVLIILPNNLKKGIHASHVCQQGMIWRERHRTKIEPIRKERQARSPRVPTEINSETEKRGNQNLIVCPRRSTQKRKIKVRTISLCAYEHWSNKWVQ